MPTVIHKIRRAPNVQRSAESPWITVKEAAEYLGVGVSKIYEGCATGGLKHVKFGHSTIRLQLKWIDAWAESLTRHTG